MKSISWRNETREETAAGAGPGILALFSILLTASAQWLIIILFGRFPIRGLVAGLSRGVLEIFSIPFVISIFFLVYYFLPNGTVQLSRVLRASIVAGLLTEVGKFVYVLTLPLFRFREVYGPFTLSVTLLFWGFVGALILLFGAHLSVQSFWDSPSFGKESGTLKGHSQTARLD